MVQAKIFLEARIVNGSVITQAEFDYMGSITIDKSILNATGILIFQRIYINNIDNGNHLWTYVIEGKEESGTICLNGSIARKVTVSDRLKLYTTITISVDKINKFKLNAVNVSEKNKKIITISSDNYFPEHQVEMLYSKIHCVTVNYDETIPKEYIAIGPDLMKVAKLYDGQQVDLYNKTNGERYEGTVIKGKKEGVFISPFGSDARKIRDKDIVILCSYSLMDYKEAKTHKPPLIFVDQDNIVTKIEHPKTEPIDYFS